MLTGLASAGFPGTLGYVAAGARRGGGGRGGAGPGGVAEGRPDGRRRGGDPALGAGAAQRGPSAAVQQPGGVGALGWRSEGAVESAGTRIAMDGFGVEVA